MTISRFFSALSDFPGKDPSFIFFVSPIKLGWNNWIIPEKKKNDFRSVRVEDDDDDDSSDDDDNNYDDDDDVAVRKKKAIKLRSAFELMMIVSQFEVINESVCQIATVAPFSRIPRRLSGWEPSF